MKKLSKILLISLLAVFLAAGSAVAIPSLQLTSGASFVLITDGGVGDANSDIGVVTFIGSVGVYNINVTTGLTKPAEGSAVLPYMDLNTISKSTGAGTLDILFSETDFTLIDSAYYAQIGGTTAGTVSALAYWSDDNDLFNKEFLIADLGTSTTSPFAMSSFGAGATTSPYSLTLATSINHPGSGTTSFDFEVSSAVPEPASMLLLGSGLIGLAGIGRKKFFKKV